MSLRPFSRFGYGAVERSLGFDVTRKGKTGPMSEGPSIDDYRGEFWRQAKVASNDLHMARLVRPQDQEVGILYRYRLFELDGAEAGEAHYAVLIEPGETIWTGDGRKLRVLEVVSVEEEDSPFIGFLKVEAAGT